MRRGQIVLGIAAISVVVVHTIFRRQMAAIVPDYLPAHRELVVAAGAASAVSGIGLMIPATQRAAAWGLFAWLLAVYPANIWMVQHPERYAPIPEWALWARLPLQLPMLWWAWRYTRAREVSGYDRNLEG